MEIKKNVLITGCSSGFGKLTAELLAKDPSVKIYASMRDLSKNKLSPQIEVLMIDVTKPETIDAAVSKLNRIDILINNAGAALGGFFEDLTYQEIFSQFKVNFFGVQNMIRAVLPLMHNQGSGRIINISSIAGRVSYPALGAYNASKWALEGFSESLYLELKPFNIDVCLVEPGSFQTKIFEENAQFSSNCNKDSKYYDYTKFMIETRIKKLNKIRPKPIRVAKVLAQIIHKKNIKFRILIGSDAKITYLLKCILPHNIFASIINFFALKDSILFKNNVSN
ncbi:MAG: SDR family oxidoreductase [bacterium]|nr:SDR family oxidoreductase [bacterium]